MTRHQEQYPRAEPRLGSLIAVIAVFATLGSPLVYFAWESINHLLFGDLAGARLGRGALATGGLVVLLLVMARVLRRTAPDW